MITTEKPMLVLAGQALLAGAAWRMGGRRLRDRTAGAGAVITAASWSGLLAMRWRARGSDELFDRALRDGLGVDYPRREARSRLRRPGGVWRSRYRYARDRDIRFGETGRHLLDVWRRSDLPASARAPVLLQVPGGAWVTGNKQGQAHPLMGHLAERGWVCVPINYRLSPRSAWPDAIVDVKLAIAWVRQHIAEFGGNPDFIVITGGSAGGHLCALAALTPDESAFQPGFEGVGTSVRAAVPFYGVYDWTNRTGAGNPDTLRLLEQRVVQAPLADARTVFNQASPMSWIRSDAPPFFLLHGSTDSLVPVEEARTFARLLRAESRNPVLYAELPGAQHAFELFDSPRARASARAVERFLDVVYGDYLRGAVDPGAPDGGSAPAEPATAARRYPGATDRAGLGRNLVSG